MMIESKNIVHKRWKGHTAYNTVMIDKEKKHRTLNMKAGHDSMCNAVIVIERTTSLGINKLRYSLNHDYNVFSFISFGLDYY